MREVRLVLPRMHPKQLFAFNSLANEILYGGSTRGGKSHLVRIAYVLWCHAVPGLQCDIFRLHLDDVIAECMQGRHSFPELLAPFEREGLVTINQTEIKWANGSLISLEHCNSDDVMSKHQGIAKHVRSFLEGTQIGERRIRWLRAWCTMDEDFKDLVPGYLHKAGLYKDVPAAQLREFFPKIIYGTNPIGPSAGYFRRQFVKARERYSIGRAPDDDGGFLRQYIPAKVEDNPSENADAVRRRVSGMGDEAITDALLNENWDAPVGDFIREYREDVHVIPPLMPPAHWLKFRGFDWGHSEPFCVLWCCVSDGEEFVDQAGRKRWYRRGAKIIYREWYGCNPKKPSEGLGMTNVDIAKGIVERTPEMTCGITLTDSLPFQNRGGKLIASEFFENGVPLTQGNTRRVQGWKSLKDDMIGIDDEPMWYVTEDCPYLRDYLPALQRHKTNPEDAVEEGEATHATDTARIISATNSVPLPKKPVDPTPPLPPPHMRKSLSPEQIIKNLQKQKRMGRG